MQRLTDYIVEIREEPRCAAKDCNNEPMFYHPGMKIHFCGEHARSLQSRTLEILI